MSLKYVPKGGARGTMISPYQFWQRFDELKKESMKDICRKYGIRYDRLLHNRSDCRFPKAEDLLALSEAVGTSAEYLLTGRKGYPDRVRSIADKLIQADDALLEKIEKLIAATN